MRRHYAFGKIHDIIHSTALVYGCSLPPPSYIMSPKTHPLSPIQSPNPIQSTPIFVTVIDPKLFFPTETVITRVFTQLVTR